MLKLRFFISCSVAFMLVTACHHHSTDVLSTRCFPSQLIGLTHTPGGQTTTSTTTFNYDGDMNLLEIRDDVGSLTFSYTDGLITAAQSTSSQMNEIWSYNGNGLLSHVEGGSLPGSFFKYAYTQDFTYDAKGKLIMIEWHYTSPNVSTFKENFTYNNENEMYEVVRDDHHAVDSIGFSGYDAKRNMAASIALAMGKQPFYFLASVSTAFAVSKNNATSIYNNGNVTVAAYEYNSSGYPSKITSTTENGSVTETTVTYTNCP